MEGVAGTSTPTQGSIWFQGSGVEDDAEIVRVEVYALKKITKDLPLYFIPVALSPIQVALSPISVALMFKSDKWSQ